MAIDLRLSGRVLTVTVNGESASVDLANIRGDDGVRGPQGPAGDATSVTELATTVNAINDYVVEQGTASGISYRKWASGLAELWGRADGTANDNGRFNAYLVFPFVFTGIPAITVSAGAEQYIQTYAAYANATESYADMYAIAQPGLRAWVCFYAVGKWRQGG